MRMPSSQVLDTLDVLSFFLLNVSASFMLSAAHNVLYFVLDWRTPVIHFLHFSTTLIFVLAKCAFSSWDRGLVPRLCCALLRPPLRTIFWPPVAAQLLVCALSAQVHAQNRTGGLYLVRIFDFLGTLVVIRFAPRFLNKEEPQRRRAVYTLLVPLALSASLSWLEFSHIEYDAWTVCLSPLLAVAQGLHLLLLKRAQQTFYGAFQSTGCCGHCGGAGTDSELLFQRFCLCYLLALCPLLAGPALVSFLQSKVPYDASWESIDLALMSMSGVFMVGYKYSELWLQTNLEPHHFCALEHTKFFCASIGQWFLQNMAHATVFAALGKALFIASGLRYWSRLGEMRAKEKCGPKSSVAAADLEKEANLIE